MSESQAQLTLQICKGTVKLYADSEFRNNERLISKISFLKNIVMFSFSPKGNSHF